MKREIRCCLWGEVSSRSWLQDFSASALFVHKKSCSLGAYSVKNLLKNRRPSKTTPPWVTQFNEFCFPVPAELDRSLVVEKSKKQEVLLQLQCIFFSWQVFFLFFFIIRLFIVLNAHCGLRENFTGEMPLRFLWVFMDFCRFSRCAVCFESCSEWFYTNSNIFFNNIS